MEIAYDSLCKKISLCILAECPAASRCLRHIARTKCPSSMETIEIVNPDSVELTEDGCQFFKSTNIVPFGVGFKNYLLNLTIAQAATARALLYGYFNNRTQFYRYRDGILRFSPSRKEDVEAILAAAGLPTPLSFDSIVYDIE